MENYINHLGKYQNSAAIQAALNDGTLANPYVAMTSAGTLDYSTLTPEEPCYLGEWSNYGQSAYAFQITDATSSLWEQPVKIGVLLGVYSAGNHGDLDVMLNYDQGSDAWHMEFFSEIASETPVHNFDGVDNFWESGVMTDPNVSDAVIVVGWNGTDTFMLQTTGGFNPFSMTTINPECSE